MSLPPDQGEVGHTPFEVHRLSLLEVSRYVRALLPRVPPLSVARSAVTRLWDAHASRDLLIQCATTLALLYLTMPESSPISTSAFCGSWSLLIVLAYHPLGSSAHRGACA